MVPFKGTPVNPKPQGTFGPDLNALDPRKALGRGAHGGILLH